MNRRQVVLILATVVLTTAGLVLKPLVSSLRDQVVLSGEIDVARHVHRITATVHGESVPCAVVNSELVCADQSVQ